MATSNPSSTADPYSIADRFGSTSSTSTYTAMPLPGIAKPFFKRPVTRFAVVGLIVVAIWSMHSSGESSSRQLFSNKVGTYKRKSVAPKPRSHRGPVYSSHNCIGLHQDGPELDNNRCHFKNVCLELLDFPVRSNAAEDPTYVYSDEGQPRQSMRMTYHRPPQARNAPLYWSDNFHPKRPWVRVARESYLTPELEFSPIPDDALWAPAEHAILQEAFWPENFGHSMGDDFLPAYRLAKAFGAWDRSDTQLIMHPPCWYRDGADRGCANHNNLAPLLLDRPYETYNSTLFTSAAGRPVCFKNVYAGTKALGMALSSENMWPQFVDELRVGAGLVPSHLPTRQRITIFLKHGRRTILNYDELEAHLRERFQVEVDMLNPAKLSLPEQLKYMQDTTVVVSPCGGVSFSSNFLPRGSSAIFVDYWDTKWNQSISMERFIYTSNNDMTPLYYPLELKDTQLDKSAIPQWAHPEDEWSAYRNWANTTINLERMERYVLAGLLNAEVSNGWQNSFKLEA